MKKENNHETDWLDLYHQGKSQNDYAIKQLTTIANNIKYVFPDIASDLYYQIDELIHAKQLINSSFQMHMSERVAEANNFIGTALSGLLNKGNTNV